MALGINRTAASRLMANPRLSEGGVFCYARLCYTKCRFVSGQSLLFGAGDATADCPES
jgi:hypothetical protein